MKVLFSGKGIINYFKAEVKGRWFFYVGRDRMVFSEKVENSEVIKIGGEFVKNSVGV